MKTNSIEPPLTPQQLFEIVCEIMGEREEDVSSRCRKAHLVKVRSIYAYLGSRLYFTRKAMGKQIGRDHSTVTFHIRNCRNYLDETKPYFRPDLKKAIEWVKHGLRLRSIAIN